MNNIDSVQDYSSGRKPVLVNDQVSLQPIFRIFKVVAYEGFNCLCKPQCFMLNCETDEAE